MIELRYHQATYAMLTGQPIDTAPYLKYIEEHETVFHYPLPAIRSAWTKLPLYQHPPTMAASAVHDLDDFENRHSLILPASVREWYSLDIGLSMLYTRDNWLPYDIETWGELHHTFTGAGETFYERQVQLLDKGLLMFIGEQQAGDWCIHLNGSDDPPVAHLDAITALEQPDYSVHFHEDAPRFSDFVYCHLWDWLADYQHKFIASVFSYEWTQSMRLTPEFYIPLERIRERFTEIRQQWPGERRFVGDGVRMSMRPHTEDSTKVGPGTFYAKTADALRDVFIWLWGKNPPFSFITAYTDETEAVIQSLKSQP